MNLKTTLLALGLIVPASVFSADYYIRTTASGSGDGSSWDNAMAFENFYKDFQKAEKFADGDAFYFAEGTYVTPAVSVATQIGKGFTFQGGYSESLTGTDRPAVDYSAHRTVISGDRNGNGLQDYGDARCLFALQSNTTHHAGTRPILIQGFDFCYVYTKEATNENANRKGALCIDNSGDVTIKNCRFYNNELAAGGSSIGGAALLNYRSTIHLLDCEFKNNKAVARGAAIRITSNSNTKGYLTLERCLLADNEVTEGTGSALCVQNACGVNIINSTIVNNKSASNSAVFINGATKDYPNEIVTIVNSTISNNDCGAELQFNTGSPKLRIVNSIIASGTADKAAIIVGIASVDNALFSVTSGGYNIIGDYKNTKETGNEFPAVNSDSQKDWNIASAIFGDNVLTDGVLVPAYAPNGASAEQLSAAVAEWGLDGVDLTVDQKGDARGLTVPGAVKADALTGKITVGGDKVATYYNNYGYIMPEGLKGYIVTTASDNKVITSEAYLSGAEVGNGKALIVMGESKDYEVTFKLTEPREENNLLCGTQEEETINAEGDRLLYKLANDNGIGFYWDSTDGKSLTNGANKAYLVLEEPVYGAKPYYMLDSVTGINAVKSDCEVHSGVFYTLSGVRVTNPQKGMYIVNGKKVVIK